jgi:hypothetical protein
MVNAIDLIGLNQWPWQLNPKRFLELHMKVERQDLAWVCQRGSFDQSKTMPIAAVSEIPDKTLLGS